MGESKCALTLACWCRCVGMPTGGFDAYAHLRLRDTRPGPGYYNSPLPPSSSSSQRTILSRVKEAKGFVSAAGPGEYDLPSTIGTGRAARLPPHADDLPSDEETDAVTRKPRSRVVDPKQNSMALCPDTPSFSIYGRLAQDLWVESTFPNAGPGSYDLPREFGAVKPLGSGRGGSGRTTRPSPSAVKGKTIGLKTKVLGAWLDSGAPGPGTYDVRRFGDTLDSQRAGAGGNEGGSFLLDKKECSLGGTGPRWARGADGSRVGGPGPGDYEDPTSIAARCRCDEDVGAEKGGLLPSRAAALRSLNANGTFSSRSHKGGYCLMESTVLSPGPAAHCVDKDAEVLAKYATKQAPRFMPIRFPPVEELMRRGRRGGGKAAAGSSSSSGDAGVGAGRRRRRRRHPSKRPDARISSDFDFDFRKGFSFLGRWHDRVPPKLPKNRFDLEEEARADRFVTRGPHALLASHPYSPLNTAMDKERAREREEFYVVTECRCDSTTGLREITPGPGSYNVRYDAVERRNKGVVLLEAVDRPHASDATGPRHYAPKYNLVHRDDGTRGPTFYKGDFRMHGQVEECLPGRQRESEKKKDVHGAWPDPAVYYNDDTVYARSIHGDAMGGEKGYRFGIRYPARAIHQVAPPKDALTNTNCAYSDERLWESPDVEAGKQRRGSGRRRNPLRSGDH